MTKELSNSQLLQAIDSRLDKMDNKIDSSAQTTKSELLQAVGESAETTKAELLQTLDSRFNKLDKKIDSSAQTTKSELLQAVGESAETTKAQLLAFMKSRFDEVDTTLEKHSTLHSETLTKLDGFTKQIEDLHHEQVAHQAAIERLEEHAGLSS